jgi:hypothetical protein
MPADDVLSRSEGPSNFMSSVMAQTMAPLPHEMDPDPVERRETNPRTNWQFSAVLSIVLECFGNRKWCPEEDSNLHDLAIAST